MANYPSRSDIVTAMRNPQVSFKSNELIGGSIIQKGSRVTQYSGGYTTVFPFNTQNSNKVAVRLWIADIGDAKRRSSEISNYLKNLNNSYFAGFKYIDDAILISGNLHAIVIMDWVDGQTVKEYINDNLSNTSKLLELANNFKDMVEYFHQNEIAHGDLQHGNILIKSNGDLVAIDYDSMYIKPLDGIIDCIKGLEGYQHPGRQKNKLITPKLDYFSELVIYLSLLVYSEYPNMWNEYYGTEDLLFSKEDLSNPNTSNLINKLSSSSNSQISELTQKLKEQLKLTDILQLSPLEELLVNKLEVSKDTIFDKWDKQPNPPTKKETSIPNKKNITDKF
jgi:serine/threonine protein kinase